jgi:Fe-S oxidoreductase
MPDNLVPPGLTYIADNIITKDNIAGTAKSKGSEWARGMDLPRAGDTILFAGCGYQYSDDLEMMMDLLRKIDKSAINTEFAMNAASLPKKLGINAAGIYSKLFGQKREDKQPLKDIVKVLNKLGIKFAYLAESEPCCGGSLFFSGLHKQFAERAKIVSRRLKDNGVKEIISVVPSCTYTLHDLVPRFTGEKFIVRHFCEVVADNLQSIKLTYPRKVKVTYHDPCQLVRYLGIIEEPRRILKSINYIELVEPKWTTGMWATCCGGGGGFEAVFPELSLTLAKNRVKELVETGAEIIVTHCPGCIMQLEAGLRELKIDNVEVLDLSQVVAAAIE